VPTDKIEIQVEAKVGSAIKNLGKVEKKGEKAAKSQQKLMQGLKAGWLGAAAAVAVVAGTIKKTLTLFAEQERAEKTLAAAMKQAGTFTEEAFQHNLKYASSLQKMTTFGDEAILSVQKMLTNFGIEGETMDKLTKATLDLAAAKGMDLKSAADIVAKSVGSSTNALSRYGIEVTGAAGSTARANQAFDNITKLFGGAAAAEVDTFSGKIKQLSNTYGDILELVGGEIAGSSGGFLDSLNEIASSEKVFNGIIRGLRSVTFLFHFATITVKSLLLPMRAVGVIGHAAFTLIGGSIQWVIGKFEFLSKTITAVGNGMSWIGKKVSTGFGLLGSEGEKNIEELDEKSQGVIKNSLKVLTEGFSGLATGTASDYGNSLKNFSKIFASLKEESDAATELVLANNEKMTQTGDGKGKPKKAIDPEKQLAALGKLNDEITSREASMFEKRREMLDEFAEFYAGNSEILGQIDALRRENTEQEEAAALARKKARIHQGTKMFGQGVDAAKQLTGAMFDAQIAAAEGNEAKQKQLKKKQAKADKAFSVFQAGMNIGTAIASAYAFTKGGPIIKGIAAAIAGVAATANFVKVAATPIPAFFQGTSPGGFTTSGPQLIQVGDNASGRERVSVEPLDSTESAGGGGNTYIFHGVEDIVEAANQAKQRTGVNIFEA